jgi:hypothetical protein
VEIALPFTGKGWVGVGLKGSAGDKLFACLAIPHQVPSRRGWRGLHGGGEGLQVDGLCAAGFWGGSAGPEQADRAAKDVPDALPGAGLGRLACVGLGAGKMMRSA